MDRQGFAILMFIFSGALLLYAGGLALGDTGLITRDWAVKMKDRKAYARKLAKILSLVALAPLGAGLFALLEGETMFPLRVLIGGIILAITLGVYLTREKGEPEQGEPTAARHEKRQDTRIKSGGS